jgi:hypothetical protein
VARRKPKFFSKNRRRACHDAYIRSFMVGPPRPVEDAQEAFSAVEATQEPVPEPEPVLEAPRREIRWYLRGLGLSVTLLEGISPKSKLHILIARDGRNCPDCGVEMTFQRDNAPTMATVDHVIPKSRGGKNNLKNLRATCMKCNGLKGNSLLEELGLEESEEEEKPTRFMLE